MGWSYFLQPILLVTTLIARLPARSMIIGRKRGKKKPGGDGRPKGEHSPAAMKTAATYRKQALGNRLDSIAAYLKVMGYDLTPYGMGVALLEAESGYSDVETASHVALTTLALDVWEANSDVVKLMNLSVLAELGHSANITSSFRP